jgi:hypothetical protein
MYVYRYPASACEALTSKALPVHEVAGFLTRWRKPKRADGREIFTNAKNSNHTDLKSYCREAALLIIGWAKSKIGIDFLATGNKQMMYICIG